MVPAGNANGLTDAPVINQKWLRLCAALAMRYGIPDEEALKMVTLNAAEIARVGDRVGSIVVGKDADLVIMDGPWYEPRSRVDMVIGDGQALPGGFGPQFLIMLQFESAATIRTVAPPWAVNAVACPAGGVV